MFADAEYWRWTESRWTNPDIDWQRGEIVTGGVDIGSVSSQAAIMIDGELYCCASMRTGGSSPESAQKVFAWALQDTALTLENIHYIVGTGYGRINVPFAKRSLTEIACHARGANFMYGPTVRTILDMGGQDCKAIRCDERGKVTAFLMNDKCAAGTGRGMEVFADLLNVPINDIGELSFAIDEEPPPVSSTCVVFAKTEASGLLREGWPKNKIIAAYCSAMANRVCALLERIQVEKDFAVTGGISKNIGVVNRLAQKLNLEPLRPKFNAQLAGAIGAALLGKDLFTKGKK